MAKAEEVILTQEGYDKLMAELEELKTTTRKELAERLKVAISYGDLKENSEYHSAKNDQSFVETRIKTLENMFKHARIVQAEKLDTAVVQVGFTVKLHDVEFDEDVTYTIVGPAEADIMNNKLSYESPLGKELIGKSVGNAITVTAPSGLISYKILEITI
ncbi:GreA/GreB family elongation factor [Paenibacillus curdlanolyticus YK9]|uniref:Transcription elongation factor GreA n=1 Tax=Paenibacillus curdlanolyticus YK9 TaxID=717606 RepID=E0I4M0_9BACL|nr:transcription elongation factor GreA [Paenibacillus curdlanolyticus]EFM12551.1 GreA/GreB family elongation factor [Paenibacillus curdlanolyticus YK9]